jgi:hypothetical protein
MMAPAKNHADDPWYARILLQIVSREGIMTTLVVGTIITALLFGWKNGEKELASRQKVNEDMASAYKTNAETNGVNAATNRVNADTNKQVADAVQKLTTLIQQSNQEQDQIKADIKLNGEAITKLMRDGTVPAQLAVDMMTKATELMLPVPKMREESNRIMGELLGVQKEVLQTLQDQSKNVQAPPTANDGGA